MSPAREDEVQPAEHGFLKPEPEVEVENYLGRHDHLVVPDIVLRSAFGDVKEGANDGTTSPHAAEAVTADERLVLLRYGQGC